MPDLITTGTSGYVTGSIDSATVLISNVSTISARHPNGIASGVVQIETVLGSGTSLRGSHVDLVARLAVALGNDGKLALSDPTKLNGILSVVNGGTSLASLPQNRVLMGNLAGAPIFTPGMNFQGPLSCGSGSTLGHSGPLSVLGNQTQNGIRYCSTFVQASGTLSLGTGGHRLVIFATDSITISGAINAIGSGFTGGAAGTGTNASGSAGNNGTGQPGGGGGGASGSFVGGSGGNLAVDGTVVSFGGAGGGVGASGNGGNQLGGVNVPFTSPYGMWGAAGGGGGASFSGDHGGDGGTGGGSIILIAPSVILSAGSSINTSGNAGGSGQFDSGSGGGGGAGNIFIVCRTFQDNGCSFFQSGGSGGPSVNGSRAGGSGASGIRQVLIYG